MHPSECPICARISAQHCQETINGEMGVLLPHDPKSPGHLQVVTMAHVQDALVSPPLTGKLAGYAALVARKRGYRAATISFSMGTPENAANPHLHIDIIPAAPDPTPAEVMEAKPAEPEKDSRPPARPKPAPPKRGTLRSME